MRWGTRNTGKSGGARVIYSFYSDSVPIFLLDAYAKSDKVKLTADDKKVLRTIAKEIKRQAREEDDE
jgi:hypothetical protein